jgi:hypothetical protein
MPDKDQDRERRLAAALRENLKKRKAQSRQNAAPDAEGQSSNGAHTADSQ